MRPVRLGIVGAEGAKFTPETEALAREVIRGLLDKYQPSAVFSGGCHLGGIDIWAVEEARARGIRTAEFVPQVLQWNPVGRTGYKRRNELITENSDVVVCITVDKLPPEYTGMRFEECYHHIKGVPVAGHVKSGGCWTMELAKRMGKHGELVVISTPASDPKDNLRAPKDCTNSVQPSVGAPEVLTKGDVDIAVAFAHVEILELKAGRRTLTQCPGLEQLGKAIEQAKANLAAELHAENFGGSPHG